MISTPPRSSITGPGATVGASLIDTLATITSPVQPSNQVRTHESHLRHADIRRVV
jgi:hypothetical protein